MKNNIDRILVYEGYRGHTPQYFRANNLDDAFITMFNYILENTEELHPDYIAELGEPEMYEDAKNGDNLSIRTIFELCDIDFSVCWFRND